MWGRMLYLLSIKSAKGNIDKEIINQKIYLKKE